MPDHVNRPLADKGLLSYRYKGPFGWIMIGALDDAGALREAARSSSAAIDRANLQYWNGFEYVPVKA